MSRFLPFFSTALRGISRPRQQFSIPCRLFTWRGRDDRYSDFSSAMKYMDRQLRQFDRDMTQLLDEFHKMSPIKFKPFLRILPVESPDGKNYKLELDLPNYKPEDIKVTLKDRMVSIHARREIQNSDGSKMTQEVNHQYMIPESVNIEALRTMLHPDGTLAIEAPLLEIEAASPKEIPVEKKTDTKK